MSVLDQYCRLCLSKDSVVAHLFDGGENDSDFPLYKKVIRCVAIKVRCGDGLPALLCQLCADRVKDIWCFREKCEMIDLSLRKLLKQNKNKLDDNWEDEIQKITQVALPTSASLKKARKKNTSLVSPLPSSVKEESEEPKTDISPQHCVKVETVLRREEDDDWPDSPPSTPSATSPKPGKEGDGKEEASGRKKTKKSERKRSEYTCEFCGRTFPRSNHLAQHELTHTAEKPFQCSECNKSFWYKASLIGHIKQTHTGDVNYTCELCGKGFFKKTELTRHKPTHSNETPHKCPQCGMGFKITKTLKRHIRNVHTAQRSHTCHTCGKSFTQLQTLKVHLVLHSGVKPYVCSYCGKGFSQSAPLKTHIRIHTGERPYSCHACGDSFSTRSALTSHAFKHSGTLPYPCTRCSSTFRLKRDLIQHEQGHDDEESRMGRSGLMRLESERTVSKEQQLHQQESHQVQLDYVASDDCIIHADITSQSNMPLPASVSPMMPQPVPASHTVGRPNPPMFHRQQVPAVSSLSSSGPPPLQTFSQSLPQAASAMHMVSQVPAHSQADQNINQHIQSVTHLQAHPTAMQSLLHPHLHPPTTVYQNQL